MIVVAVMVILMAIVIPGYQVMSAQSRRNTCAANLKAIGQALALFREDYQCYPPDSTEYLPLPADPDDPAQAADVVHAAYDPITKEPITSSGLHGLGLYTLYYLGAYASALPPSTLEPEARLGLDLRQKLTSHRPTPQGLNGLLWYRSGGYVTKLDAYHCPANAAVLPADSTEQTLLFTTRANLPDLKRWNNYDLYYRRNFWFPGTQFLPIVGGATEDRHLLQPYPPADTVVTWCPYHRSSRPPSGPGQAAPVNPGDQDLVLFADGSVHRMASRADNRMFEQPKSDTGWPAGPIM
jgi:type II secretory pathway pseudopilin PulG